LKYRRENPFKASFFIIFSADRYIEMAIKHGMAIALESKDLYQKYEIGEYPPKGWEEEARKGAKEHRNHLVKSLCISFCWLSVVSIIAIIFGIFKGKLDGNLPIDAAKLSAFIGTFLASWATLFELGGAVVTWKGEALHEKVHPIIFQVLFISGIGLILSSIIA